MKKLIGYTPTSIKSGNTKMSNAKTPNFTTGSHNTADETSTLTIANEIISSNLIEFQSMFTGRDPRLPEYEWITDAEVREIHANILRRVGGKPGLHNAFDLHYAIEHPMTSIVGIDKDVYYRICECAHLLARIFVDCGAQVSATVFLTLCKKNHIKVSFKLGEIYDIFSNLVGPTMDFDTFYMKMKDHLIPTRRS